MSGKLQAAALIVAAGVVYVAAAVGLVFAMGPADAATVKGNQSSCVVLARVAESMARMRDAGQPWGDAQIETEGDIVAALANPNSILKDADDGDYAKQTAHDVWHALKANTPSEVALLVYTKCMKPA